MGTAHEEVTSFESKIEEKYPNYKNLCICAALSPHDAHVHWYGYFDDNKTRMLAHRVGCGTIRFAAATDLEKYRTQLNVKANELMGAF